MGLAKTQYLSEDEVRRIAEAVLRKAFAPYGYVGFKIQEVEDFDGEHVFRLIVSVSREVPARVIIDANHEIHVRLRKAGEYRFVILETARPDLGEAPTDQDTD